MALAGLVGMTLPNEAKLLINQGVWDIELKMKEELYIMVKGQIKLG